MAMFFLNGTHQEIIELIRQDVRQSDEMFCYKNHFVVLMGTTSKSEAIKAANRYGNDLEGCLDMRCSISSFPEDGRTSRELLSVLQQRLKEAMQLEPFGMVAQ